MAARLSGLYVNERRPVTTKQEVDAASSNTEQMPNQISIMIGGAKKNKKLEKAGGTSVQKSAREIWNSAYLCLKDTR